MNNKFRTKVSLFLIVYTYSCILQTNQEKYQPFQHSCFTGSRFKLTGFKNDVGQSIIILECCPLKSDLNKVIYIAGYPFNLVFCSHLRLNTHQNVIHNLLVSTHTLKKMINISQPTNQLLLNFFIQLASSPSYFLLGATWNQLSEITQHFCQQQIQQKVR